MRIKILNIYHSLKKKLIPIYLNELQILLMSICANDYVQFSALADINCLCRVPVELPHTPQQGQG